jgi:hypothetical protein
MMVVAGAALVAGCGAGSADAKGGAIRASTRLVRWVLAGATVCVLFALAPAAGRVDSAQQNAGVTAISAGGGHTCALKDGGVWCWGGGQLAPAPVPFEGDIADNTDVTPLPSRTSTDSADHRAAYVLAGTAAAAALAAILAPGMWAIRRRRRSRQSA